MLAYNKRKAQLERWRESDTERESVEIKNRPKKVKFADKCIFQAACAANDKGQVAKMVKEGYDINAVDEDGITALHQACIEDNLDMVEFLLKHGADVNISDNEGWTPLHAVATCCYVSIARVLLEHGANVVALNNDCSIPLDICKSDEIRNLFIQDVNGKGIDLKEARRGEEIKLLQDAKNWLANGYSEEPHPITGATALHVAACKGYIRVLEQVIKAGADVNKKDVDGWTPLHAAAFWGQKEACQIFLENGSDISMKDNGGQTAYDVAEHKVLTIFEAYKRKKAAIKKEEKAPAIPPPPVANTQIAPTIQAQQKPVEKEKPPPPPPLPKEEVKISQPTPPAPVTNHTKEIKDEKKVETNQGTRVPPPRDEESETQRKAHAKRVRETRRSTQGVTLEELKSAEQYVRNSMLGTSSQAPASDKTSSTPKSVPATALGPPPPPPAPAPPAASVIAAPVPAPRKEENEVSVERRPSWRLRVDEQDPSKFSLEDTRSLPLAPKIPSSISIDNSVQRSSSLRSRTGSNRDRGDYIVPGKPPKPPDNTETATSNKTSPEDEIEKDSKNSGAQWAILRKKKTKRRSTGIVQYNQDGTEISQAVSMSVGSDIEASSGSGPSSDGEQGRDSSKNENGVSNTINYKKLYEEVLKENQMLKNRLVKAEEDVADLKIKLDRISLTPRITSDDVDRREKRALERKLSEMEEELKESRHLRTENQKLRDENGALIRVISKLSK